MGLPSVSWQIATNPIPRMGILGCRMRTASACTVGQVFVHGVDVDVVDASSALVGAASDSAVNAGAFPAVDQAVIHLRRPVSLVEFPDELVGTELAGAVDVVGVDFKIYDSWPESSVPILQINFYGRSSMARAHRRAARSWFDKLATNGPERIFGIPIPFDEFIDANEWSRGPHLSGSRRCGGPAPGWSTWG